MRVGVKIVGRQWSRSCEAGLKFTVKAGFGIDGAAAM
jgi:hypothetical protein